MSSLSPCVRLCVLDPASGHCRGCGRTMAEIAAWAELPETDRQAVMARLPGRIAALTVDGWPGRVAR